MRLQLKKMDDQDWIILALLISWGLAVVCVGYEKPILFAVVIFINVVATAIIAVKLLNKK